MVLFWGGFPFSFFPGVGDQTYGLVHTRDSVVSYVLSKKCTWCPWVSERASETLDITGVLDNNELLYGK